MNNAIVSIKCTHLKEIDEIETPSELSNFLDFFKIVHKTDFKTFDFFSVTMSFSFPFLYLSCAVIVK